MKIHLGKSTHAIIQILDIDRQEKKAYIDYWGLRYGLKLPYTYSDQNLEWLYNMIKLSQDTGRQINLNYIPKKYLINP